MWRVRSCGKNYNIVGVLSRMRKWHSLLEQSLDVRLLLAVPSLPRCQQHLGDRTRWPRRAQFPRGAKSCKQDCVWNARLLVLAIFDQVVFEMKNASKHDKEKGSQTNAANPSRSTLYHVPHRHRQTKINWFLAPSHKNDAARCERVLLLLSDMSRSTSNKTGNVTLLGQRT